MKNLLLRTMMVVFLAAGFTLTNAQVKNADIMKASATECVTMDGLATDYVWSQVPANAIDVDYTGHTPTLNSATWKGLWTEEGLYILIEVDDNVWVPDFADGHEALGNPGRGKLRPWNSDKPEIYLDSSIPLEDGGAPNSKKEGARSGNYQFASAWVAPESDGTYPLVDDARDGFTYSTYYDSWDGEGKYIREFFVAWDSLRTDTNAVGIADPLKFDGGAGEGVFGFDITILDQDTASNSEGNPGKLQRAVWQNDGSFGESFTTFDGVLGTITIKETVANCAASSINNKVIERLIVAPTVVDNQLNILDRNVRKVEIVSISGQVVQTEFDRFNINVSTLAKGVYIVKATSHTGVVSTAKILKQ